MYKFTNGIVVFDTETRDRYIKAGMSLVEEKEKNDNNNKISKNGYDEPERFGKVERETERQPMDGRVQEVNSKNSKKKL